jgi:type IV secretory pathway VirB4 component
VYIGSDLHGGSFVYDPWLLYQRGLLSIANTLVLGMPDYGKSALTKCWLYRSRVFGRRCEIIDPKGEYQALVNALGGVTLCLEPGGQTRLNPLTRIGTPEMREGLLQAVARAMLARPLRQAEAVGLSEALAAADEAQAGEVCVGHVVEQLRDPAQRTTTALDMAREQAREVLREAALALMRLCHGPLKGMFDAPTSAGNAWDAPVLCLDISRVAAGGNGSDLALAITMVCATAFLDAQRTRRTREAERVGREGEKTIRVNDEAWRALPIEGLGEYYQAAFKLGRQTGVQHWMVLHRLSDLTAAGDSGTRQQALAKGLLAETGTVIVYRQHPEEITPTTSSLGLTSTESQRISHYPQGVALWKIGGRSYEVRHIRSAREQTLTATDAAMARRDREGPV